MIANTSPNEIPRVPVTCERVNIRTLVFVKTDEQTNLLLLTHTLFRSVPFLILCLNCFSGIVRAVARELYNSEIKMEILSTEHEEERNGKKEHVTFAIFQKKIIQQPNNQVR